MGVPWTDEAANARAVRPVVPNRLMADAADRRRLRLVRRISNGDHAQDGIAPIPFGCDLVRESAARSSPGVRPVRLATS